jgi:hypothetical protein
MSSEVSETWILAVGLILVAFAASAFFKGMLKRFVGAK